MFHKCELQSKAITIVINLPNLNLIAYIYLLGYIRV